jgi:hypothetical protein
MTQLEIFWFLQLQFLVRSSMSLADVFNGIRYGGMYEENKHTKKMIGLLGKDPYMWTNEEHDCLATHLAVVLSGIEEGE